MNIWILGSSCLVSFTSRVAITWQKTDICIVHPSNYLKLFQSVERNTYFQGAIHITLKQVSVRDYMKPSRNTFSSPLTIKGDYSKYLQRKHLYCRQIKLVRWILTIIFFGCHHGDRNDGKSVSDRKLWECFWEVIRSCISPKCCFAARSPCLKHLPSVFIHCELCCEVQMQQFTDQKF